jgi:hypothetical protein
MIAALSSGGGLAGASSINPTQQTQGISGLSILSSLTGGQGTSGSTQSAANISGPGQLLSNLQQLQTLDPTKFQQLVAQIAGQLQTAAQKTQGPQSTFLANLASQFQNVANGGSLSQLQPQSHHHHHHHPAQQAYSQNTQSQSQGVAGLAQTSGSQSSASSTMQQLFSSISKEVSQALAG